MTPIPEQGTSAKTASMLPFHSAWTAEGRERYGEGGAKSKSDVQKYKAKVSYNTQKYKSELKSKAQKEKDKRAAKEERVRIKENAKTTRFARKEQAKFDKLNKKEEAKLNNQGRPGSLKFGKTKNMSDDDLQKAIDRLKLQAEYNKQYTLATQPNSALAKADRFFDGPTGRFVSQLAIQTLPDVAKKITEKALEDKPDKVAKELDIMKKRADIESTLATAHNARSQGDERYFKMRKSYQEMHDAEVKARAEKMFGSNKQQTQAKPSSANATAAEASNPKIVEAQKQTMSSVSKTMPQQSYRNVYADSILKWADPTKPTMEIYGGTPQYVEKKKTFKIGKKKK